ncbi:MAG: potassium channel family protein [Bacteroidota bacterium]
MALATDPRPRGRKSNAYQIFILVLTVLSLAIMVWLLMPITPQTRELLNIYDNIICFIFLYDFAMNMLEARKNKTNYFIKERGWLDLLGSIPSFGITTYGGLLRLARLSRLARIGRLLRGQKKKELIEDVLRNRNQYTAFITILLTVIVLTVGSVLVLQFESKNPDANIQSGWDAIWYSIVTITTVGYGDRYPITYGGRITAMFIMFMGVGIIGALASILSSLLVGSPSNAAEQEQPLAPDGSLLPVELVEAPATKEDVAILKNEIASLRTLLEKMAGADGHKQSAEIKN